MLLSILTNLSGLLSTIGDVNQEDFNKCTFPLYNVYFAGESDIDNQQYSLKNTALFEIHCYNKNEETSNARFDNDYYLYDMLTNIKQLLYTDPTIGNTCEEYYIVSAKPVLLGKGEDILLSEKLVILLELIYRQDSIDTTKTA
jgi:hypothetical protein